MPDQPAAEGPSREVPRRHHWFLDNFPDVAGAYESLGQATQDWGPLDKKTRELIKLGIAVGNRHEGATHSHARRALDAGAGPDEVRHAVLLSLTTIGFPNMIAALTWVEDVLRAGGPDDSGHGNGAASDSP